MRTRYFNIGDRDWGLLLCWNYDIQDREDLWSVMESFGLSDTEIGHTLKTLSKKDTGLTITDFSEKMSVVFISEATSEEEWLDTLFHELKHVVEHISAFYGVKPQSESAAYLQGELGRQLFPIILSRLCRRDK